jgi:5-(carboxyamino)imidazole ribonucleotide synthase
VTAVLPGGTIGILGGGQLGRMTALAARELGYRIHVLDPDPSCAASPVAERVVAAPFDDAEAAAELARGVDVVTLEIEKIAGEALAAAARCAPLRPSSEVLRIVRDRGTQKEWLAGRGFPLGDFRVVRDARALVAASSAFGDDCFVKLTFGGYDGRGQIRVASRADAEGAWDALGARTCVVERAIPLAAELSVMVARRPSGEVAVYPPSWNHAANRILDWSVIPADIDPAVARDAERIGRELAVALDVEGLLAVELFLDAGGRLLVNELAPRPHNTFHHTQAACLTSQFEQFVRAICDLPLGATEVIRPSACANLLGDLWANGTPDFEAALAIPGVQIHLYGKGEGRPGRKMGHINASASSREEAVARVLGARDALLAARPSASRA